jgi:hypothetical protein
VICPSPYLHVWSQDWNLTMKALLLTTAVTPLRSTRTEFSAGP